MFASYRQYKFATEMTVYVRTALPSSKMFGAIRREMRNLDPNMPLFDMNTMENQLDRSLAIEKFTAFLSGAFGVLATILAILGLYGVTTYDVERRWREIGIRMALGAATGSVLRLVLRDVLLLALMGIGIGLPLTWGLTQFARKLLYGVEPRDAVSFAVAVIGLLAVATLAGVLPAHRASRLNPIEVLRYE